MEEIEKELTCEFFIPTNMDLTSIGKKFYQNKHGKNANLAINHF